MELSEAVAALAIFSGKDLTSTLSQIEFSIQGRKVENCSSLFVEHHVHHEALSAAGLVKSLAGQINVMVHALGILLCLPELLHPNEIVENISLGAGNTGKKFDLETNLRVAEFKFINWQGGPEAIRQNSLFKDFYGLAEHSSHKFKYLYVLGKEVPLKFLNGRRSIESVLSKNVTLHKEFRDKYPEYKVVRDYFLPRCGHVEIEDVSLLLTGLTDFI